MSKAGAAQRHQPLRNSVRLKRKRKQWHSKQGRSRQSFSTIEVCHFFDISKATLYRWERQGLIAMPTRDWRNWRLYTSANIAEIKSLIRRRIGQ